MNIRKPFISMNLQRKVRFMFLYMMLICIIFWFSIFYIVLESKMETTVIEKEKNNRVAIIQNFDITMQNLNSISWLTMLSRDVTDYLTTPKVSASHTKKAIQDIYVILNSIDPKYSITIFRNDSKYINTGAGVTRINKSIIASDEWLSDVLAQRGGFVLKSNTDGAFIRKSEKIVTFARIINDINTQKRIGLMTINLPMHIFEQTYSGLADSNNHFAFYDKKGYIISSDDESVFMNMKVDQNSKLGQKTKRHIFEEKVVTIERVEGTDFFLVTYSRVDLLQGITKRLVFGLFGGILIILFFIGRINTYITKNVTKPIQSLVKSMAEVQNGFLHRVSINVPNDEIGLLKNSYNAMLIEINQLIEELVQKEKNLKKAELDALQEQIKPHFLYNTLETIRYLVLENETKKVYDMLETLGNFYRKFLSKGSIDILLEEEIGIVKNYLYLQNNRYEDVFDAEFDIQEGLDSIRVPRLILQPLVENSLYHGVRLKGEKGLIKITAYKEENLLHIKIYDTGIGMSKEQEKRLLEGTCSKSFGFKGTIERIRYYYKVDDVFDIHTKEGEFCEVELKLPLKEGI